jgi:hypothetical protein
MASKAFIAVVLITPAIACSQEAHHMFVLSCWPQAPAGLWFLSIVRRLSIAEEVDGSGKKKRKKVPQRLLWQKLVKKKELGEEALQEEGVEQQQQTAQEPPAPDPAAPPPDSESAEVCDADIARDTGTQECSI